MLLADIVVNDDLMDKELGYKCDVSACFLDAARVEVCNDIHSPVPEQEYIVLNGVTLGLEVLELARSRVVGDDLNGTVEPSLSGGVHEFHINCELSRIGLEVIIILLLEEAGIDEVRVLGRVSLYLLDSLAYTSVHFFDGLDFSRCFCGLVIGLVRI